MNRIFFNEVRRTPVRRYAAICIFTLLAFTTARADSERHWTEPSPHAHKGIITTSNPNYLDSRGYIGEFTLSYALWSLLQDPVHDYIFSWDWRAGNHPVGNGPDGNSITTADLAKYPDLAQQFAALKPVAVTLKANLEFYDAQNRCYARGQITVCPDLIGAAREKEPLHVPGSPHWENYFEYDYGGVGGILTDADRATRNKKLFEEATSVKLVRPKITAVDWPEGALSLIAGEFTRREAAEKARLAEAKKLAEAKAKLLASAPTNPPPKLATGPNPFEQAAQKPGSPNPFEQAANGPASSGPANPFELAQAGVRTGPENPFETNDRLERERQAELARQAEIARQEQARRDEIARQEQAERDRKEELARQEEQRRQEYLEQLAAQERNYEADAADRAYRRAYNQQNRDKAAYMSRSSSQNFGLELQRHIQQTFGNSASSTYVDPSKVVGYRPGQGPNSSGGGPHGTAVESAYTGTDSSASRSTPSSSRSSPPTTPTFAHRMCPGCHGTGKITISAGTHNEVYGTPGTTITCDMCGGKGWVYQ